MTINKILKVWAKSAGIDKHLTFHTSRHTFGTLMMTVGADLYTTCKLMGHSDVRTTQIYAKIVDSKKIEAVNLVDKMFEKRNEKRRKRLKMSLSDSKLHLHKANILRIVPNTV